MQMEKEIEELPEEIPSEKQQPVTQNAEDIPQPEANIYYNNTFQYILSLLGMAVGYGSFWRFPYLIYENGGGVFLIPYILIMVFVGIPLLYHETALGQMFQCSIPLGFGRVNRGFKWLAIMFLVMMFQTAGFYNIILAYSYRFLFAAFQDPLPFVQQSALDNKYFTEQILGKSDNIDQFGTIQWPLFLLYIVSLIICYIVIRKGVQTSGRVVIVTALMPYFFFIVLGIRAVSLQGASMGLQYLFYPKWEKLFVPQIWVDATIQVFFQLGVGIGAVWNLSSLRPKNSNMLKSVYIIPLSLFICGMLCALDIFMYLGHFCLKEGTTFDELSLSGIQLSFNVFPKALAILPFPNVWVFVFFLSMVFLGLDSQFAYLEAVYCYLKDQYGKRGYIFKINKFKVSSEMVKIGSIILLSLTFGIVLTSSAGIYYLQYMDQFIVTIPLGINIFLQTLLFTWVFPIEELEREIKKSKQIQPENDQKMALQPTKEQQQNDQSIVTHGQQIDDPKILQPSKNYSNDNQNGIEKQSHNSQQNIKQKQKKHAEQIDYKGTPKWIYYSIKLPFVLLILFGNMILTVVETFLDISWYVTTFFILGWIVSLTPYILSIILGSCSRQKIIRKTFEEIRALKTTQLR